VNGSRRSLLFASPRPWSTLAAKAVVVWPGIPIYQIYEERGGSPARAALPVNTTADRGFAPDYASHSAGPGRAHDSKISCLRLARSRVQTVI